MPRPSRSNPLALAVLVCLFEKPMHPYEIAHTLRMREKHESVRLNYGSLYAVVDSLEKRGLIRAQGVSQQGQRPPRTVYEITDAGTAEIDDWMSELVMTPSKEFPQFQAALSFLPVLPIDEVLELLRRREAALAIRLAALRRPAPDFLPRVLLLEGEFESALVEAELAFVRRLVADIDSGSLGGIDLWHAIHEDPASVPAFPPPSAISPPPEEE